MTRDRIIVTDEFRGPLINIACWLCITASGWISLVKIVTKYSTIRQLQGDDYYAIVAILAAVAQTVAVAEEVNFGLGQPLRMLSARSIRRYQESFYASQLFYVIAMAVSKMITLHFLKEVSRDRAKKSGAWLAIILNTLWGVSAFFVVAFQCSVPYTWNSISGQCINESVFWDVVAAFDIIVDIMIVIIPIHIIYNLQLTYEKKINVWLAFAGRILMIPIAIVRCIYIHQWQDSSNKTLDAFNFELLSIVAVHVSILVANVTFCKPFLRTIQTGMLTSEEVQENLLGTTASGMGKLVPALELLSAPFSSRGVAMSFRSTRTPNNSNVTRSSGRNTNATRSSGRNTNVNQGSNHSTEKGDERGNKLDSIRDMEAGFYRDEHGIRKTTEINVYEHLRDQRGSSSGSGA